MTIYLAGGCFWGLQKYFDQFPGVRATEVGYANGPDSAPTYREVCDSSGHAETVKIEYDPNKISLRELLDKYFLVIDPLSVNKQGNDGAFSTAPASTMRIRASFRKFRRFMTSRRQNTARSSR